MTIPFLVITADFTEAIDTEVASSVAQEQRL